MNEQLSKTKMCKFEQKGLCTKGSQCPFAHDVSELQPIPDFSCSKLCTVFRRTGRCDDPKCLYAHEEAELQTSGLFYKTKICKYWQAGNCSLGSACSFAHDERELKKSISTSSNCQKDESLPKPNTNFTEEHATQNQGTLFNGSFLQDKADRVDAGLPQVRTQQQPRHQKRLSEQQSCSKQEFLDRLRGEPKPAHIKLDSLKTAFSVDSSPADIDLLSMFPYCASDSLDDVPQAKLTMDSAAPAKNWKDWSKADIAACPEFVPLSNFPQMPTGSGWPLWVSPNRTLSEKQIDAELPWILPSNNLAMSPNFGDKPDTIWKSYFDDLLNLSGDVDSAVDEAGEFPQGKNHGMLTVADVYKAKQMPCH